jgi:hypothetical protein
MNLDLVAAAPEQRGAASGTDVPVSVFRRRAADRDRIDREDRGGVEHRAMMLTAIKAMADADAVRRAGEGDAHCAAQAAAGKIRVAHHSLHEPVCPANLRAASITWFLWLGLLARRLMRLADGRTVRPTGEAVD